MERAGRVMGRALVEQADVRLIGKTVAQLPYEPRLADAGLA
jgi:hypothetical protein